MTIPAVFKFVNWITGTPVPIDDAMTSALTAPVDPALLAAFSALIPASGGGGAVGGRLTLITNTPVLTTNPTGISSHFWTPYNGQKLPIWDGSSAFEFVDMGGELTQTNADTTKSPAAVANNSNYDIFGWEDGSTKRATRGPAWSTDTTRGTGAGTTELESLQGVYVNKVAITNGPAARLGTYLGTLRSNGTATYDYILGGAGLLGVEAKLYLWNYYNRLPVNPLVMDTTVTWNYNSTTWRNVGGSALNRISFIRGIDEDAVLGSYCVSMSGGASGDATIACSLDAAAPTAAQTITPYFSIGSFFGSAPSYYNGYPGIGLHYLQAAERQITTVSPAQFLGLFLTQQMMALSAVMRL